MRSSPSMLQYVVFSATVLVVFNSIGMAHAQECKTTAKRVPSWYYGSKLDGPYECTDKFKEANESATHKWAMLPAYRSGGVEGVHWKYTKKPLDAECLENWIYFNSDGTSAYAFVTGRTTQIKSEFNRFWCALPVYRPGGRRDAQFQDCYCASE